MIGLFSIMAIIKSETRKGRHDLWTTTAVRNTCVRIGLREDSVRKQIVRKWVGMNETGARRSRKTGNKSHGGRRNTYRRIITFTPPPLLQHKRHVGERRLKRVSYVRPKDDGDYCTRLSTHFSYISQHQQHSNSQQIFFFIFETSPTCLFGSVITEIQDIIMGSIMGNHKGILLRKSSEFVVE